MESWLYCRFDNIYSILRLLLFCCYRASKADICENKTIILQINKITW